MLRLPMVLATFGVLLLAGPTPEPSPKILAVTTEAAMAGQFKVKLFYQLPGAPDSALTRAVTGISAAQAHRLPASILSDSFLFVEPATLGAVVNGQVCVQSKRRGQLSGEVCRSWTYTVLDRPPPPPVIDSVKTDTALVIASGHLYPESKSVTGIAAWTMCMLYQMKDGHAGYRGPRDPECSLYQAGLGPAVTVAQQAVLDAEACTTWAVLTVQANGTTLVVAPLTPCSGAALAQSGVTSGFWRTPNLGEWRLAMGP